MELGAWTALGLEGVGAKPATDRARRAARPSTLCSPSVAWPSVRKMTSFSQLAEERDSRKRIEGEKHKVEVLLISTSISSAK